MCIRYGNEQLQHFESTWLEGFYAILSECVVIYASRITYIPLGEHTVLDQEAIYDRLIGVLVSNRDLGLPYVLSAELAAYPPSMTGVGTTPLYPDGNMRVQMENPI